MAMKWLSLFFGFRGRSGALAFAGRFGNGLCLCLGRLMQALLLTKTIQDAGPATEAKFSRARRSAPRLNHPAFSNDQ
jgi:hypothetical protein